MKVTRKTLDTALGTHFADPTSLPESAPCPFCGGETGYTDPTDTTSDFGCPTCKAFVDVDGAWTPAYRGTKTD